MIHQFFSLQETKSFHARFQDVICFIKNRQVNKHIIINIVTNMMTRRWRCCICTKCHNGSCSSHTTTSSASKSCQCVFSISILGWNFDADKQPTKKIRSEWKSASTIRRFTKNNINKLDENTKVDFFDWWRYDITRDPMNQKYNWMVKILRDLGLLWFPQFVTQNCFSFA